MEKMGIYVFSESIVVSNPKSCFRHFLVLVCRLAPHVLGRMVFVSLTPHRQFGSNAHFFVEPTIYTYTTVWFTVSKVKEHVIPKRGDLQNRATLCRYLN